MWENIMSFSMKVALAGALASSLIGLGTTAGFAAEVPVDLSGWTAQGYPGNFNWVLQPGNNAVRQTVNGSPTVFFSDYSAFGNQLSGTIQVATSGDDDFVGFVVGFNSGDLTAATTDFLLIDWKQGNQGTAKRGLALSHVTEGLGDDDGAWAHNPVWGVDELARGATLGDTGWADNVVYSFDIAYTSSNIKVWVNDVLQFDVNGSFSDGRFGFYNYSQASVLYAGITNETLPPPPPGAVPEPASWAMMILGLGAVGTIMRRQQRARIAFA
jgi:hypothetical protein